MSISSFELNKECNIEDAWNYWNNRHQGVILPKEFCWYQPANHYWCYKSNDSIFDKLIGSGEWFGHFYYDLYSQHYDKLENPCPCEELDWQQEYDLFCNSEQLDEVSSLEWYSVEDEIKRCNTVNRKRKKHKNDIKTDFIKDKTYWIEDELAGLQIYIKHKYHKHKRAERVFTEDEYGIYFWYYEFGDLDGDYEEDYFTWGLMQG